MFIFFVWNKNHFFHNNGITMSRTATMAFWVCFKISSFSRLVDFFLPRINNVFLYFLNTLVSAFDKGTLPFIILCEISLRAFSCELVMELNKTFRCGTEVTWSKFRKWRLFSTSWLIVRDDGFTGLLWLFRNVYDGIFVGKHFGSQSVGIADVRS